MNDVDYELDELENTEDVVIHATPLKEFFDVKNHPLYCFRNTDFDEGLAARLAERGGKIVKNNLTGSAHHLYPGIIVIEIEDSDFILPFYDPYGRDVNGDALRLMSHIVNDFCRYLEDGLTIVIADLDQVAYLHDDEGNGFHYVCRALDDFGFICRVFNDEYILITGCEEGYLPPDINDDSLLLI